MLYLPLTRYSEALPYSVLSTVTSIMEGSGLVYVTEGGVGKVSNGTASNSEMFAGVAIHQLQQTNSVVAVETLSSIPAGGTYVLSFANVIGVATAIRVKSADAGPTINTSAQAGAAGSSGQVQATTSNQVTTLTFNATDVTNRATIGAITITYRYTPTVIVAEALSGDGVPGPQAAAFYLNVGAIKRGVVYTDQFDAGEAWDASNITDIKLTTSAGLFGRTAAGGAASTGADVRGTVLFVPTATIGFLGLDVRA